ncbi:hypothetical protein Agabi119p4_10753 [Agaricus bisporus var. burnettii]|uniref:DNA endonuclease activator Ctp1 C-terminal domain-containing protein n=1 Tax=Agaricus bisporus var. burnettii TaxID=192524 RepID=A0A8H7EVM9_AGABI|nr:hypothetical protein Agabi119p4_10753 [Agaricus bisporus var. burnettii]
MTPSSSALNDKLLVENQQQKEQLASLDRKIQKLKRAINDVDKEKLGLQSRCSQLAESLGFTDIGEVQRALDVADHEVTFKQAFERVQVLELEANALRKEKESSEGRCSELEERLNLCRERNAALEKNEKRLQEELKDTNKQYDAMKDARKRAAEYYQRDRRILYKISKWLCVEPLNERPNQFYSKNSTALGRRELLREFGPALTKLLGLDIPALEKSLKEGHDATYAAENPVEEDNPFIVGTDGAPGPVSVPVVASSSTPPVRKPLSPSPTPNIPIKREAIEPLKPLQLFKSSLPSSDTEDDSQASSELFKIPLPSESRRDRPAASSDTEDDSQAPSALTSSPDLPPITSPFSAMKPTVKRLTNNNLPSRPPLDDRRPNINTEASTSALRYHIKVEPEDDQNDILQDKRPAKRPRISLDSSVQTPKLVKRESSLSRRVFSTGQIAKGKKRYENDENTPVGKAAPTTQVQTRLENYTYSKGRGRHTQEKEKTTKTINSVYKINPQRNGGFAHQYDEVVRGRAERSRMDAGDCEECRDWYTAVGPMPIRDRGPLWRSPSTTPVKRCEKHVSRASSSSHNHDRELSPSPSDRSHANIEYHKKQISRHRHNWARAQTPFGFWNIAMPSTQEVNEINERAEEMHQRKFREVEKEAERGRWIRR